MVDKIIDTLFFMLPTIGATVWFLKILISKLNEWKKHRENKKADESFSLEIFLASILVTLGLYLCFFMIWHIYFRSFEIPVILKIFGFILYFVFLSFSVFLYGISRAVAAGAGSATGILSRLFRMISEDDKKPR